MLVLLGLAYCTEQYSFFRKCLLSTSLELGLVLCAGCTALMGLEVDCFHPPPPARLSPCLSEVSRACPLPSSLFFPGPSPLYLSVFCPFPSPVLPFSSMILAPAFPVTVQEIPGSAIPEAGRDPEGEALCQRTVQGQEGFIPSKVRAS